LAAGADVVVENSKVGVLVRFRLDHAAPRAANPRVIYCSVAGFGQDGPYAARAGYDFIIQAMGGIMDPTGEPDGAPQKPGVACADLFTGLCGVIAAALAPDRPGGGASARAVRLGVARYWRNRRLHAKPLAKPAAKPDRARRVRRH
jgi:crotonobetainyl-CoA:carnitine CoA-transferase CaiB-like acyl-CoA transferase